MRQGALATRTRFAAEPPQPSTPPPRPPVGVAARWLVAPATSGARAERPRPPPCTYLSSRQAGRCGRREPPNVRTPRAQLLCSCDGVWRGSYQLSASSAHLPTAGGLPREAGRCPPTWRGAPLEQCDPEAVRSPRDCWADRGGGVNHHRNCVVNGVLKSKGLGRPVARRGGPAENDRAGRTPRRGPVSRFYTGSERLRGFALGEMAVVPIGERG